jgi:hypothetical protein
MRHRPNIAIIPKCLNIYNCKLSVAVKPGGEEMTGGSKKKFSSPNMQ